MKENTDLKDKILGCLIGGALGDSLGNPIEFFSNYQISRNPMSFKKDSKSHHFRITDDTQMTFFSIEGLLNYFKTNQMKSILISYHRWLKTQGFTPIQTKGSIYYQLSEEKMNRILDKGFLVNDSRLNHQEAPGHTTLNALMYGKLKPENDSKGCGGIMRAAPAGLLASSYENAYYLGKKIAQFTHNHPTGYIAAGAFAMMIYGLLSNEEILSICRKVKSRIVKDNNYKETLKGIDKALSLSKDKEINVSLLGEGWIAEETLSIALYCFLKYPNDFEKAVELSVNHGGDSDSTGAVCGNLLGAELGLAKIQKQIDLACLNIYDIITRMGDMIFEYKESLQ